MQLILGLGSNLGDRKKNILQAVTHLRKKFELDSISRFYQSDPVDFLNQPQFINATTQFEISDGWAPEEILDFTQSIEKAMGREKLIPKGPRNIDIDILFIGTTLFESERLTVPHPAALDRSFVMQPLKELPFFSTLSKHWNWSELPETGSNPL